MKDAGRQRRFAEAAQEDRRSGAGRAEDDRGRPVLHGHSRSDGRDQVGDPQHRPGDPGGSHQALCQQCDPLRGRRTGDQRDDGGLAFLRQIGGT